MALGGSDGVSSVRSLLNPSGSICVKQDFSLEVNNKSLWTLYKRHTNDHNHQIQTVLPVLRTGTLPLLRLGSVGATFQDGYSMLALWSSQINGLNYPLS